MRRAAKRDVIETDVVAALRKCGYLTYRTLPTDLLIHHPFYGDGMFRAMELKSTPYTDKRQEEQQQFLVLTGTKIIRSVDEALKEAGVL